MSIRISELPSLVETRVLLEVQQGGDESPWELEGTLMAVSDVGVVVKTGDGTHIFLQEHILDISKSSIPRKIVRRKIRYIIAAQARQHLLDRHGMPWDLTKMLRPDAAREMHDKTDHSNLGHQHRTEGDDRPEEEMES